LLVPVVLVVVVLVSIVVMYVRGTWAVTTPTTPAPGQGPVSEIALDTDGTKMVRAAVVLPYPRDQVWKVVTDYAEYGSILIYLNRIEVNRNPDGSVHMQGLAQSALYGYWPFAIDIHEKKEGDTWTSRWNQQGASGELVRVNRGGWTVTALGSDSTLLVLTLEAEVGNYPTFFLRNYFLARLPRVLRAVESRIAAQARPD
jgi:hypothetical protein